MGIMDNVNSDQLQDKAGDAYDNNQEKADQGLDKAGDFANEKTGGEHGDKIDSATDSAGDKLDGLSDNNGS